MVMSSQLDWFSDEAHRAWLTEALAKAAAEVEATVVGELVFGWRERTLSGRVRAGEGEFWLRVVSDQREFAEGDFWTGNVDASTIVGVAKPRVLRHWDWADGAMRLRAELMTLLPGRVCSSTPELRHRLELPQDWWRELHESLAALREVDTMRVHLRQEDISTRLTVFFGDRVADTRVSEWTAAHTDLHWANLLAPECALVDWEGWGVAPAGFDAACLYLHSLLVPEMAERVHAELAAELASRDGLVSQLYVIGRMLLRVNAGDYPDLALPLHHHAERVIAELSRR